MVLSRARRGVLVVLGFSCLIWGCGAEKPIALSFESDPGSELFGTVFAAGASAASELTVRVAGAERDAPSVLGTCSRERDGVRFRPRFPFTAGLSYHARYRDVEIVFTMPERDPRDPPRVEAVYPSALDVPENLLRLYVHFSRPMRAKDAQRHVRILDSEGAEVPLPFVEVEPGLWDGEGRRLTLFFHPGRIKRGLEQHAALGPPLRAGGTYRLVVDRAMQDAFGYELEAPFERELRVGPADRRSPDPSGWKLRPVLERSAPIEVELDEPLDRALLLRLVRVTNESGEEVPGAAVASGNETRFTFTPTEPWSPGVYSLVVDPEIEDLAGNKPGRLFDVELGREAPRQNSYELPFEVR